jgi:hypothetical protein
VNLNREVPAHIKALILLFFKAPVFRQLFLELRELIVVQKVAAVLVVRDDLHADQLELHLVKCDLGAIAHLYRNLPLGLLICLPMEKTFISSHLPIFINEL